MLKRALCIGKDIVGRYKNFNGSIDDSCKRRVAIVTKLLEEQQLLKEALSILESG